MKKALLLVILAVITPALFATDRPALPPGFSWQEIPEIHSTFLRPNGWFFRQETDKGTRAFFITKEDISGGGSFHTGLTINVFPHLREGSALDQGKALVDKIVAQHPRANHWNRQTGPFEVFGCLVTDTDNSGTSTVMTYVLANPKTNTLYLLIFESPELAWSENSEIGKQIMSTMSLDDKF